MTEYLLKDRRFQVALAIVVIIAVVVLGLFLRARFGPDSPGGGPRGSLPLGQESASSSATPTPTITAPDEALDAARAYARAMAGGPSEGVVSSGDAQTALNDAQAAMTEERESMKAVHGTYWNTMVLTNEETVLGETGDSYLVREFVLGWESATEGGDVPAAVNRTRSNPAARAYDITVSKAGDSWTVTGISAGDPD